MENERFVNRYLVVELRRECVGAVLWRFSVFLKNIPISYINTEIFILLLDLLVCQVYTLLDRFCRLNLMILHREI